MAPNEELLTGVKMIGSLDGFVFIAQEYNLQYFLGFPHCKNALDMAREAWFNKAAGIVSYGSVGGARAAEHLRGILSEQSDCTCSYTSSVFIIY